MFINIITVTISTLANWLIAAVVINFLISFTRVIPFGLSLQRAPWILSGVAITLIILFNLTPLGEMFMRKTICTKPNNVQIKKIEDLFKKVCLSAGINYGKYILAINQNENLNACALGRKTIIVNSSVLLLPDDEIMAILSHELGHHLHGDTTFLIILIASNIVAITCLRILELIAKISGFLCRLPIPVVNLVFLLLNWILTIQIKVLQLFILWPTNISYYFGSRKQEYEADRFAVEIGFKQATVAFLNRIKKQENPTNKGILSPLFSTHPDTDKRIKKVLSLN